MNHDERRATLILNALDGLNSEQVSLLLKTFGSAAAAVQGAPFNFQEAIRRADQDLELIEKFNIQLYFSHEGPYPRLLREIVNPPMVLYSMGEDIAQERPAVAIVGSRRCSYYGEKAAKLLTGELSRAGITTVSGLARGIDTRVHQETLREGGKTWAVVGSGLSILYPPENRELAKAIERSGALISEFPMAMRPYPANFPRRNRIIAGLTLGTVVIEGGENSGSLITARLAAEEGREVFAVPGPITSHLSAAPHRMIRQGAKMVESAQDILEELGIGTNCLVPGLRGINELDSSKQRYADILSFMGEEALPRETLAQRCGKNLNELTSLLLEMEMKGWIRSLPGGGLVKS